MQFRVLGPVEVAGPEGAIDLGGPRQRAVLARLLVAHGTVVSTDLLIEDVYNGNPPASALSTVQGYVSNLRRALEPGRAPRSPAQVLIGRAPGYVLAVRDGDWIRFGELVERAGGLIAAGQHTRALTALDAALALWRGEPYADFAGEPWAAAEVARLNELRMVAIEQRYGALLAVGRPYALVAELETFIDAHPLREELWRLLALALYRTGRQADALAALREARRRLDEELGLDPGPELRQLEADIFAQSETLLWRGPASAEGWPAARRAAGEAPSAPPAAPARPYGGGEDAPERGDAPRPRARLVVGRERQLGALDGIAARVETGEPAVALVTGEPGIGKTWLLEAFEDGCRARGWNVVRGRCHDTAGAPAFWPWTQVLRALDAITPPAERDRPLLAHLLDEEPTAAPEAVLVGQRAAVARWLGDASRERPLLVALDDLHWADADSLGLLGDVAALAAGRIALAATLRTGDESPALRDVLGRLARLGVVRLPLTGLDAAAVARIAEGMGVEAGGRTLARLAERTSGNPFFVRESLRLLATDGPERALEAVPESVADVIRRRLSALPGEGADEVLGTASVAGREFDPELVAEVCGRDAGDVFDMLDAAVVAGVLLPPRSAAPGEGPPAGAGRLRFAHDLVRETLYADVPPLRRARLHQSVMRALAVRPGSDAATVAHHAVEAGAAAYADAAHWAAAAAEQAGLRLAYEEAAAWWARAVAAHSATSGDRAEHVRLLLRYTRALLDAGDALGARVARADAVRAADQVGNPELAARALTALDAPSIWTLRNPYEAVELRLIHRFGLALDALPAEDSPLRVHLLGGLAGELYDGSDDPRSHTLSAEAIAMARRVGDPALLAFALNSRYLALPTPLHVPEIVGLADEILELATEHRLPAFELLAYMLRTHMRTELFELAAADEAAERCDALLERMPLPWPRFQHTMWRAHRLLFAGRFEEAEAAYGVADGLAERIGMWYAGAVVTTGRVFLKYAQGTMAEAGELIDNIVGIHPTTDHDARVLQLCAQGRREEAARMIVDGWPTPPRDWSWLSMTCLQGAAQAEMGDVTACKVTYDRLLPYAGRLSLGSAVAPIGPVDWFLGRLATAMGDHASARDHHRELARRAGQEGLLVWRDRARAELGPIGAREGDGA
ncbi:BTAD domain-containing putative transcriptional regulator [Bailinhaonella thermotolerans]|uniref:BTAD domain-containing putative transcriptional regulator n=1 Tax=Bailinhaonella thermotolerans TaxID=1070861 RepID=UPI0011C39A1D|nr:BTAD domain-containing putative transcriptional regulator [Bailinhaonella thermotolerans]